jgi:hypothetical protein
MQGVKSKVQSGFYLSGWARPFGVRVAAATATILAVSMPFATPSPNITSPKINPTMGPGKTMILKSPKKVMICVVLMIPVASNNPGTRYDLFFTDKANAVADNTAADMPTMCPVVLMSTMCPGVSIYGPAIASTRIRTRAAPASTCATTILESGI